MQKQKSIDFDKFCGRDLDGEAKATCTLQIAFVNEKTTKIEEIEALTVLNAEVAITNSNEIVTIDLKFEDYMDFEYLQAGDLCVRFNDMHGSNELAENATLILTITQNGTYEDFLIGQEPMWAFTSEKPEDRNHVIRFWFTNDNFIIYRLSEQEIERVLEQIGEDIYIEEIDVTTVV